MKNGWDDILRFIFNLVTVLAILGVLFLVKLLFDRPSKDDESIRSIRLHDIPWIEPVELKCTYFRQDTGAIR